MPLVIAARSGAWIFVILWATLLVPPGAAQEPPQVALRLRNEVSVMGGQGAMPMIMLPAKCDREGNVYLRAYQDDVLAAPVVRLSPDGQHRTVFDLRKVAGFEKAQVHDFAISAQGEVYVIASTTLRERQIARLTDEGNFDSSLKLEGAFEPYQMILLPSSQFFVSGEELSEKDWTSTGKAFNAIFNASGRLVGRIQLSQDVFAKKPNAGSDAGTEAKQADWAGPIQLGMATVAEDGNIYLMRATQNPVIYVISPGGAVLRRLEVRRPADEFRIATMKVAYDKIVLEFTRKNPKAPGEERIFSAVDAESGHQLVNYSTPKDANGIFACFTPNAFTFVSQRAGQLILQELRP